MCYLGDRFTNCAKRALKTRHVWGLCYTLLNAGHGYSVLSPRAPAGLCWAGLPRARCSRSLCLGLPPPDPLCHLLGHTAPGEEEKALVVCQVQGRPCIAAFACGKAAEYNNISWVAVVAHSEKVIKKEVYESGAGFFFFKR